jgi:two-component sensor histidine kinase
LRPTLLADDALIRMTIADGIAGLSVSPLRPSLGTPVVQPLAKQIGAAITTQSEPDHGTTIHVSMKLHIARATKFATTRSGK